MSPRAHGGNSLSLSLSWGRGRGGGSQGDLGPACRVPHCGMSFLLLHMLCARVCVFLCAHVCTGEGNATHSSVLAWRIPGTGEPGGLLRVKESDTTEQLSMYA